MTGFEPELEPEPNSGTALVICVKYFELFCCSVYWLRRMHEMQTIVTDVHSVGPSVCLSVTQLNSASLCKNG